MIHQYKNNGYNIVMDVNSGSVHIVDDVVYDVIPLAEQLVSGGIRDVDTVTAAVEACQKLTYSHDEVREAVEEILELAQDNVLFTEDIYEKYIGNFKQRQTVVKALCLHIAHDCNLACQYCFAEEGEYHLVVESVDKTDTAAYSDVKNLKLAFVVDQTAPVVVFSGLESGGRYEAQEQTVTAVPTDDGGKLKTFQAVVTDKKGEQKETLITLEGDELETYLAEHDGRISFEIPEGLEQQVTVSCSDHAVKEDGSTNIYNQIFDNVTVSTSKMIIFFANKPLFYGVILVCCAAAAGVIGFVIWKKKKKVKKEEA